MHIKITVLVFIFFLKFGKTQIEDEKSEENSQFGENVPERRSHIHDLNLKNDMESSNVEYISETPQFSNKDGKKYIVKKIKRKKKKDKKPKSRQDKHNSEGEKKTGDTKIIDSSQDTPDSAEINLGNINDTDNQNFNLKSKRCSHHECRKSHQRKHYHKQKSHKKTVSKKKKPNKGQESNEDWPDSKTTMEPPSHPKSKQNLNDIYENMKLKYNPTKIWENTATEYTIELLPNGKKKVKYIIRGRKKNHRKNKKKNRKHNKQDTTTRAFTTTETNFDKGRCNYYYYYY